jgi:hypothetical protein
MAHKKAELNHKLLTENGECCACQFLRTALKMMAPDEKPQFQKLLDEAAAMHATEAQPEFWISVNREADPWAGG